MDIFPDDYRNVTDKLPVGASRKIPHKGCSSSACLRVENTVDGMKYYCFKCHEYLFVSSFNSPAEKARRLQTYTAYKEMQANKSYDLPPDFSHSLPPRALAWLGAGGFTIEMITRYNIGWSEKLNRVIIPIVPDDKTQGYVARAVETWQRPKYLEKAKPGSIWVSSCTTPGDACVVCEDILSAGRCGEFIQGYALLGTSLDTSILNKLIKYKHVLLWLDPDAGGRAGVKSMINRIRLFTRCTIVHSDKDPKLYTRSELSCVLKKYLKH